MAKVSCETLTNDRLYNDSDLTYLLRRFGSTFEYFFDVNDVRMSRRNGRRTGMHCTMMVPTISDENQMFECAFRQKYHSSLGLPPSFHPVRMAATIATTIPRLMVMQRPIFSILRISKPQVMIQGNEARTKSMMMLYTETRQQPHREARLLI
jgi:hypothetical protein